MQHSASGPEGELEFIAGAVCLDFANTVEGTHSAPTQDHIASYADLVRFARAAGLLTPAQSKRVLAEADRRPQLATEIYRRAIAMREAMARAFSAIPRGHVPNEGDLRLISAEAADAEAHARLVRSGQRFTWEWPDDDLGLSRPLWPIARSAQHLLTDERDRIAIRECASDTCGWLFVDRSRSRSRRWCDMSGCGNRAKQRRFQRRQGRSAQKTD